MKLLSSLILLILLGCNKYSERADEYSVTYFKNGRIAEIVRMENGKANGKAFRFNEDGTKSWEFNYRNNKREGIQLRYYFGKLIVVEPFVNGEASGWSRYYSAKTGCLSVEGTMLKGMRSGLWYEYSGKTLMEIDLYSNDTVSQVIYRNVERNEDTVPQSDCGCTPVIVE